MNDIKEWICTNPNALTIALLIIGGIISIGVLWIKSFVQSKAEATAKRGAEKELELVKKQHQIEIEDVKKKHEVDLRLRTYQYEAKQKQYFDFFKRLDQFNTTYRAETQKQMVDLIEEFNRTFIDATFRNHHRDQAKSTTTFSRKVQKLLIESEAQLQTIRDETGTMKLIASESVRQKLNELDVSYKVTSDYSGKMLHKLPEHVMNGDKAAIVRDQETLTVMAVKINSIRDEIIELMRTELSTM